MPWNRARYPEATLRTPDTWGSFAEGPDHTLGISSLVRDSSGSARGGILFTILSACRLSNERKLPALEIAYSSGTIP